MVHRQRPAVYFEGAVRGGKPGRGGLTGGPSKKSGAELDREIAVALAGQSRGLAVPSSKAVDFFRKHAGHAVRPGESKAKARARDAEVLARAEAESRARGWTVDWEYDSENWQSDAERPFEVLIAILRDADGHALTSLGSIGMTRRWGVFSRADRRWSWSGVRVAFRRMTGNKRADADYRRVVEAELADQALGEHGSP